MKSIKPYIFLFIGLAAGFALGVILCQQYFDKVSIIPGWHTTVSPNIMSVKMLLYGLAVIALGMLLGRLAPFLKNHFTIERLEVLNIGIAITGIVVCLGVAWDLFESWYLAILPEQFAFYTRKEALFTLLVNGLGVLGTQLFWVEKIRRNPHWALLIAAILMIANNMH
jgi:hypothetical protein